MRYGCTRLYHQIYAETLPKSGGFLLARTGRWGDQKNVSVIWPGDLSASLANSAAPWARTRSASLADFRSPSSRA